MVQMPYFEIAINLVDSAQTSEQSNCEISIYNNIDN